MLQTVRQTPVGYPESLMAALQIGPADLEEMARMSQGFRSMLVGTAAEIHLARTLGANLAPYSKNPDSDRSKRSDFTVLYKDVSFRIELKSELARGFVNLKTSDTIVYDYEEEGVTHYYSTTAMPVDRFDVLAVSLFNRGKGWGFAFLETAQIKRSTSSGIPEQFRDNFLTGRVEVDDYDCVTYDPYTLFDRILARQANM